MHFWKHIAAIVSVAVLVVVAVTFLPRRSAYACFLRQPSAYFVQLAQACETLRQTHPMSTNGPIVLSRDDPRLPSLLRELNADEIRLFPDRLWIGIGTDRNSFAILWESDRSRSNTWVLMTDHDGVLRQIYMELRP